jgi:hypothetical protein
MKKPLVSGAEILELLLIGTVLIGSLQATGAAADDGPPTSTPSAQATNDATEPKAADSGGADTTVETTSEVSQDLGSPLAAFEWQDRIVQRTADSQFAAEALNAMQNSYPLEGSVTLEGLADKLSDVVGVPVWLDERAVEFAQLDMQTETIDFPEKKLPLSISLQRFLHPLGLKAVVRNEGIVITADRVALARKGIGAYQWVNVDEKVEAVLEETSSVQFNESPLIDALQFLGKQHGIQINIDTFRLEELGLSSDVPVTADLADTKLRTVLETILKDLDLTTTIKGEILQVTTQEAAESALLTRIYLLAGTGLPQSDVTQAIQLIQTSIASDTWEAMGGPSTISPIYNGEESSLVVSTTLTVHHEIESLLSKLRESSFSDDPIIKKVQVPTNPSSNHQVGGMF